MKVKFQAINWEARDLEDASHFVISIFGKTIDGQSVCVNTQFKPYFFVKNRSTDEVWRETMEMNTYEAYSVATLKQKDMYGFRNNEKSNFTMVTFDTDQLKKKWGYRMKNKRWKLYEFNIPPLFRFFHRTGIQPTGWIEADISMDDEECLSNCDTEGWCSWNSMKPIETADQAPIVTTSFDIECHSESDKFPNPETPSDKVIQIACSSQKLGSSDIFEKVCFVLGDPVSVLDDDYKVITCPTEHKLVEAFRDHLDDVKCDVLTGWHIFGFDLQYIYKRLEYPIRFGRLLGYLSVLEDKELSSSALGNNHFHLLHMPGIFSFDLLQHIRKEYKLPSYKLNDVAKHFLDDEKIDIKPREIFEAWRSQDLDALAKVAQYCVKDTSLPIDIINKTCSLINVVEMAKATWVPMRMLIERGQQIKVFSQIAKKARELGFLIPTDCSLPTDETYEGATVLDPHVNVYWNPVTALDFKSLYPSIMRAHKLCYSTYVMDDKYLNKSGIEYEHYTIGDKKYTFAVNVPSVLPAILEELAEFRTQAKRDMKKHAGTFLAEVFDGKQLAYKVSMNSIYGFTGVTRGILPCMPIASTVTSIGRDMIIKTKEMVEKEFPGSVVRYGDTDSVMVEFKTDTEGSMQESWDMGVKAAAMATELFTYPNELELEKIYTPFFLFAKKRYAGLKYEDPTGKPSLDVKGIQLVRRDNCQMVKRVSRRVLDLLLYDRDVEGASNVVKDAVVELLEERVSIKDLVISKTLRDSYKSTSQPHITVRDNMRIRNPGSEARSGERVPFIYINTGNRDHKQFQKAEDPEYVKENGLPLDIKYYINNQLKLSIVPLFKLLHDDPDKLLFSDIPKHRLKQSDGIYSWNGKGELKKNQPTLMDMWNPKTST